jgi:hypothetical protein
VEESTLSETKETAGKAGAGIVEASAHDRKREGRPYQGAARDECPQGGSGCSGWRRDNGKERKHRARKKKTFQAQPSEEKKHMQEMTARMNANHAEIKADSKADQEELLSRMEAKIEINRERDREDLKE